MRKTWLGEGTRLSLILTSACIGSIRENPTQARLVIGREEIKRAMAQMMDGGGDEADERRRASELGKTAKKAVENGGSSS